jgi:AGZA family xanthine/uracil permease-like MFS transporter
MLGITLLGVVVPNNEATGMITTLPTSPVGLPNSLAPVFLQLDLGYFWHHLSQSIGIVVALLFVDLFDNIGTLIGVCNRIGLLDQDGNIPKVGRAFLADAGAAITGSCLGTSTVTCYIESAVGVEEGARTGLMACVSAACMLLALFLTPLIVAIPAVATSAALIVVGIFMMQGAAEIDLKDFSKAVPAVVTMIMMPLTFSIAEGIGLGLVVYVGFMLATNRGRAVSVIAYILTILFLFQSYFKK